MRRAGEVAADFWRAVVGAGVQPAGLGARDTLRLEAGLPLHGHELGPGITPLQAGLGWVVSWDKGPFRGREPLEAERISGPWRRLRGLLAEGRRPPRAEDAVLVGGEIAGEVTSGNFSPVLQRGIALAFLPPGVGIGAEVDIALRGGRRAGDSREASLPAAAAGHTAPRRRSFRHGLQPHGKDAFVTAPFVPHTDAEIAEMLAFLGSPILTTCSPRSPTPFGSTPAWTCPRR